MSNLNKIMNKLCMAPFLFVYPLDPSIWNKKLTKGNHSKNLKKLSSLCTVHIEFQVDILNKANEKMQTYLKHI
jgi:hypothetical protein